MADTCVSYQFTISTTLALGLTVASAPSTGTVFGEFVLTNYTAAPVTVLMYRKGNALANLCRTFAITAAGGTTIGGQLPPATLVIADERWAFAPGETAYFIASAGTINCLMTGDQLS